MASCRVDTGLSCLPKTDSPVLKKEGEKKKERPGEYEHAAGKRRYNHEKERQVAIRSKFYSITASNSCITPRGNQLLHARPHLPTIGGCRIQYCTEQRDIPASATSLSEKHLSVAGLRTCPLSRSQYQGNSYPVSKKPSSDFSCQETSCRV